MKMRRWCALLALGLLLTGCSAAVKVAPAPVGSAPTPTTSPTPSTQPDPAQRYPNSIGAYREALGPGLVVTGYTALARARVELRVAGQVVQSAEVAAKDGGPGRWSVEWPAPQSKDAEVALIDPADGRVLVKGAVSPEQFVGLFHSATFMDTRVDAKAADRSKLQVAGKVSAGEKVRIEFQDASSKIYRTEEVPVTNGAFAATLAWPPEAYILHFYSLGGNGSPPTLGPIIQVVAR